MRVAYDLEANGFLDSVTLLHCLVIKNVDTGDRSKFGPASVELGLRLLMSCDLVIGHNIINYDIPVAEKLYPWFYLDWDKVVDTLVLSRLVYSNLNDIDENNKAILEAKLRGSHKLEAWGIRLKLAKIEHEDWTAFTPEMMERCSVDVDITERLWKLNTIKSVSPVAADLEHRVAIICARQERYGFPFDEAKAEALTGKLLARRAKLESELQETFQPFYMPAGVVEPKRTTNGTKIPGTWQGAKYTKIKLTVFNPGSRHHVANRLKKLYNWVPTEFTDTGQPKIDETVLEKLPWPEAQLLNEYYLVGKRLGLVSEGDNAWLKHVKNGRVHGSIIPNGAITGRGTHKLIANVPRVSSPYGKECRELFTASKGRVQVGIDVSGLELRMLAHFLARWDQGAYGKVVCDGDVHWANVQALELTQDNRNEHLYKIHAIYRDGTKTFIYAFLYGGGDVKIGTIIYEMMLAAKAQGLDYMSIAKTFFNGSDSPKEAQLRKTGKTLKARFIERTPGLRELINGKGKKGTPGYIPGVKAAAARGYLIGLDGRSLHIRSDHAALNVLLQSGGSLVCKRWMVEVDMMIQANGWSNKVQQLIWYHDEMQFDVDPDIAEEFGKAAVECIQKAADFFNIRVPLTGEFKIGANWKECH